MFLFVNAVQTKTDLEYRHIFPVRLVVSGIFCIFACMNGER